MVDLSKLKESVESRKRDLAKKSATQVDAIRKRHVAELEVLRNTTQAEELAINNDYSRRAAGAVYQALKSDYETIVSREGVTSVSEEALAQARRFVDLEEATSGTSGVEKHLTGIIGLLPNASEIRSAMKVIKEGVPTQKTVTSYIGIEGNIGYLVTPVKSSANHGSLVEDLEDKIFEIMTTGEVVSDAKVIIGKTADATAHAVRQTFKADLAVAHEFTVYQLSGTMIKNTVKPLAEILADKFNDSNVQPKKLKDAKLSHRVEVLDSPVLKFFSECKHDELYSAREELEKLLVNGTKFISAKQAEEITGKIKGALYQFSLVYTKRTNLQARDENGNYDVNALIEYTSGITRTSSPRSSSPVERTSRVDEGGVLKLHYTATTEEGMRAEAYELIRGYLENRGAEARVSAKEATKILGLKKETTFYGLAIKNGFNKDLDPATRRKSYSVVEIKEYLDSRTPMKHYGWAKRD